MKLLVATDLHGSAYYTKKVVEAFHKHECDRFLLLGDILYHGPRNPQPKEYDPKKVIALLNPLKDNIIACRGNCDSEVDQMVLAFSITADYQSIPFGNRNLYLSHGHVYHPDNLPTGIKENDMFLFGHIHVPIFEKKNGILIFNPGSISLPKQESKHSYAIIEDTKIIRYDDNHIVLDTYPI